MDFCPFYSNQLKLFLSFFFCDQSHNWIPPFCPPVYPYEGHVLRARRPPGHGRGGAGRGQEGQKEDLEGRRGRKVGPRQVHGAGAESQVKGRAG